MRDVFKLPSAFDKNEWFVLAGMAIAICCYIAVPRILSRSLTVTIFLTFAALGLTADVLIGVDYPIDFYTIMDSPKLELFDLLVYSVNYPLYGYFYAYAILKFELDAKRLAWFIPCWTGLTVLMELIALKFKVYAYQEGWNIGFSALAYLFVFSVGAALIKLYARLWRNRQTPLNGEKENFQ